LDDGPANAWRHLALRLPVHYHPPGISISSSPPVILQKSPESNRYKFRKGYAMFVRIAVKAFFIGLDESGKMSKVSI
jgi:hypothetical protein